MTRRRYKNKYPWAWERDPKPTEIRMSDTRAKTYAEILDAWREFYTQGLIDENERKMLKKLLRQELCSCNEPSEQEELERINKLANSLKGTLDKTTK